MKAIAILFLFVGTATAADIEPRDRLSLEQIFQRLDAPTRAKVNDAIRADWRANPLNRDWAPAYPGETPPTSDLERADPVGEYIRQQDLRRQFESQRRQRARLR